MAVKHICYGSVWSWTLMQFNMTVQRGLTMSWGVSLLSAHSRRWWSSQIPQTCHSLLSPLKPPDDLHKQRHVNMCRGLEMISLPEPDVPRLRAFGCILKRWKGKLHLLGYGSDAWTVLVLCGGRYGGNASKTDACTCSHPCREGLIGNSLEGAGDRSGSELGRSPGARWQM